MRRCYYVHYKHDEHGSDSLGVVCSTLDKAKDLIDLLHRNPAEGAWADWLKDATLWVADCDGNIIWS